MLHTKIILKKQKQSIFWNVSVLQNQLSSLITTLKNKYYSKVALVDTETFLNNKKTPAFRPLFHENKSVRF